VTSVYLAHTSESQDLRPELDPWTTASPVLERSLSKSRGPLIRLKEASRPDQPAAGLVQRVSC